MYTLRFSNSARPAFPAYERNHADITSVALEILRVREELESGAGAHEPIVEDSAGREVTRVPTASRRREVREKRSAEKAHASGARTQTVTGHDVIEVTEIDGRYVSSRWVGSL